MNFFNTHTKSAIRAIEGSHAVNLQFVICQSAIRNLPICNLQ
jgi:hypothetical protein